MNRESVFKEAKYKRMFTCFFYCRTLCEAVKDFIVRAAEVSLGQGDEQFVDKCQALKYKLDLLLHTLQHEEIGSLQQEELQQVVRFCPLFL
jgi:hypothetical protein